MVVRDQRDADLVVTLKNYYRRKPQPLREAESRGTPVYVLRANTGTQMQNVLAGIFPRAAASDHDGARQSPPEETPPRGQGEAPRSQRTSDSKDEIVARAMMEAEHAITAVIDGAPPVTLDPQDTYIRRLQHQLAERYNLGSRSRGREPRRRVEIYRAHSS